MDVGLRSLDGTVCFDTSPPSLAEPSSAAVNMVSIRPAVQLGLGLLTEPSFRARAREVQAEIAAMPGPGYAAEVVESVVSAVATTDGVRRRSTAR